MLGKKITKIAKIIIPILLYGVTNPLVAQPMPLSLFEAERIAISVAPELQQLQAKSQALAQQAIANAQLPDPKLIAGTINVPTNTFSFTQDEMTMIGIGLEQSFPRGHSRKMKYRQTKALATAEQRKVREQMVLLLQTVRKTWLDLYYWTQAAYIIHANRTSLTYLLKVTKSQYSAGRDNLSNVLQVKLELSRLNDQSTQIQQQIDILRAQLGRWIGQGQADRPLTNTLPYWSPPPPLAMMQTQLEQHPLLRVDAANIAAAHAAVAFAKEQFKPDWTVDVGYGIRQGNMIGTNGMSTARSNMLTAEVAVGLPFFTKNRQSRRLQASTYQLEATQLDQEIHYRDLLKELMTQYAMWQRLSERNNLYARQLVPEAKQNSKAALLAYRSATTDLTTVLRAYTNARNIQLEQLQIQIERAKVRAALFYLEGALR